MTGIDYMGEFEGEIMTWVASIPEYQRQHIEKLLDAGVAPLDTARLWLEASGPSDTAPYGGIKGAPNQFFNNVLREFQKLACGDAAYEEDRKKLASSYSAGKMTVVSTICLAIEPHVGASAILLGPAIAVLLGVVVNAGKATTCEALSEICESIERSE